jgi:hypothetical protein
MHLAKPTTAALKRTFGLISFSIISSFAFSQENSPYSRYGIGDIVPNQNVVNRGMGGIAAGYSDYQSINFINPAALGNLRSTVFDLGADVDIRTLKSNTSPQKFKSVNTLISYLQVGFPIASEKMSKKGNFWGVSFGLRPVTRINYKIEKNARLNNIDSLNTLYEGSGGITQANVSTGIKIKNFSFGLSSGYGFGNKDYSTKLEFINDSVNYYKSNTANVTRFGGVFLNAGLQYDFKINKEALLRIGAYGNFQQSLNAKQDKLNETYAYDGSGGTYTIDTVSFVNGQEGKLVIPATYGLGFTYTDNHWLFGADFETTNWEKYRYFNAGDAVQNSYTVRLGAQYLPATTSTSTSRYWSFVKYRAGMYYGTDYVKIDAKSRTNYGVTLGAALPLTKLQRNSYEYYRDGDVMLNTGIEYGSRGSKESQSLRENVIRFSVGVTMSARWFIKPKYD